MPGDVEAPQPIVRVQAMREGAPGVDGEARPPVEEEPERVAVPARAALVILIAFFTCGFFAGILAGYYRGWRDGAGQAGELVTAATRCVNNFRELATLTVQAARIVGVKPNGNRRRELPAAEDALYGPQTSSTSSGGIGPTEAPKR